MFGASVLLLNGALATAPLVWITLGMVYPLVSFRWIVPRLSGWKAPLLPSICALAVTATTPYLVWMSSEWVRRALSMSDRPELRFEMGFPTFVYALAAATFLVVFSVASFAQAKGRGRILIHLTRALAVVASAALIALVISANPRADARFLPPSEDDQELVGVIQPAWKFDGWLKVGEVATSRVTLDDVTFVKRCTAKISGDSCRLSVVDGTGTSPSDDGILEDALPLSSVEALEVWCVPGGKVFSLRSAGFWGRLGPGKSGIDEDLRREFRYSDGRWRWRSFHRGAYLLSRRANPLDFVTAGVVVILVSLVAWSMRIGTATRRRAVAGGIPGTLSNDGWVTLQDRSVLRVDGATSVPPGPVLVRGDPAGNAYRARATVAAEDLRSEPDAALTETVDRDIESWEAAILTVTCLAAAPLLAIVIVLR
jgi:hypothetical protein